MTPLQHKKQKPSTRPSVAHMKHVTSSPQASINSNRESTLITRRRFLYGAVGVGAAAAVGIGAATISGSHKNDTAISYLDVPKHSLLTLDDFTALENTNDSIQQVGEFDLPYGTLVWASDESIAACLLPTESGSPIAQIGLLFLSSGLCTTVIEAAIDATDGYEIYDVRANSNGIIWTEANIMLRTWRIYTATISDGAISTPVLLEEGDEAFETPTLTVEGNRAFWLVNPRIIENDTNEQEPPHARLMAAPFGKADTTILLESNRRMSTPPYAYQGTLTIAPRIDSASLYYQLTNLDAVTGEVLETVTLPHAITPIEAGYGETGFMFSFPNIYDYNGAISNLGTYTPISRPDNGDYGNATWFNFARTPTAAPAWCNGLLIIKSTYAVCGINLNTKSYFAIGVENGADSYGEYLASTGASRTFVTYTNINHTPVGSARIYTCRVKVWTTLA